jgi:anaerobic magnesium-protoporphyrin IX monomethyl ester cyclase
MKFALVNPPWSFKGSIYFGCREPHLPLEFGYAKTLLEHAGHEVVIIDSHLFQLSLVDIGQMINDFRPDYLVVTTAPNYLFWRCPPPELRVPAELIRAIGSREAKIIVVGPHGSTTPQATLTKVGATAVIRGEFEEILPRLAGGDWADIPALFQATREGEASRRSQPHRATMENLPPLRWPGSWLRRHSHHHHRFDIEPQGPGAEMETSRGCPFHCSFCAKENFRGPYRRRPLAIVLTELDHLLAQGVEYVYFIDEIFLPDRLLLEELLARRFKFGIQTRIDLWDREAIELLGRAGCVSVEAGIESVTPEGRRRLNKPGLLATDELAALLIFAKRHVAFVQANLVRTANDDRQQVTAWRQRLHQAGVWANDPVPLFYYPGSPAYRARWGEPDDLAWERAHADYLGDYARFCELQESEPLSLPELELAGATHG